MTTTDGAPPGRRPHPVQLEVEYPERLSRLLIFVKLLLIIPHLIALWLLNVAVSILTFLAWFAILITGRYPKAFFEFTSGVLRWGANVSAYTSLLRDEYPPFSFEPAEYPLQFDIERAERQSRFRLFIRIFAIIPNQIVFSFVQIGAFFTTFIAWFAILLTGRYPRGLFRFSVGVLRWSHRISAYTMLLRDEYPPYSVKADARPGNEVVSALIGLPLFGAYLAVYFVFFIGMFVGGGDTVYVDSGLDTPAALRAERPSGDAGRLHITLTDYDDNAFSLQESPDPGYRLVAWDVLVEQDGWPPAFYAPFLFSVEDCLGSDSYSIAVEATFDAGPIFRMFWRDGREEATIYFEVPDYFEPCELSYLGLLRFRFY